MRLEIGDYEIMRLGDYEIGRLCDWRLEIGRFKNKAKTAAFRIENKALF